MGQISNIISMAIISETSNFFEGIHVHCKCPTVAKAFHECIKNCFKKSQIRLLCCAFNNTEQI